MKWGVRRTPEELGHKTRTSPALAKAKAQRVFSEVQKYKNGGPAGNQNCQLCTWAMEMQFRGENVLPRPVYSPRDVELGLNGYDIVKNPKKESIKDKNDVLKRLKESGDGSRFYTHVKWAGGSGGHEFIVANFGGEPYVVDGQAGLVSKFGTKSAKEYFDKIDYASSFMVRMDDKEINRDILKYNDKKYITEWDQEKDIRYMYKHNMLSKEDIEAFGLSKRKN